jgi:hypothetical protein
MLEGVRAYLCFPEMFPLCCLRSGVQRPLTRSYHFQTALRNCRASHDCAGGVLAHVRHWTTVHPGTASIGRL